MLGSLISSYKYQYKSKKNTPSQQHEILNIIERLEGYKKYQQTIQRERKQRERKEVNKAICKIKKNSFRRAYYRTKPVTNPYIYMYEKHSIAVDPHLEQKYNSRPLYTFYEFRHLKLPKSDYDITAGHAWHGLIKSWKGYKIAKAEKNKQNMKLYGFVTQSWADMLELPFVPDFDESSLESFYNSKKLKISSSLF